MLFKKNFNTFFSTFYIIKAYVKYACNTHMNQFIHQNSFRGKQHYFQFFTLKSNKTIANKGCNGSLLNFKYAFEKTEIRGCQWKKTFRKIQGKENIGKKTPKSCSHDKLQQIAKK